MRERSSRHRDSAGRNKTSRRALSYLLALTRDARPRKTGRRSPADNNNTLELTCYLAHAAADVHLVCLCMCTRRFLLAGSVRQADPPCRTVGIGMSLHVGLDRRIIVDPWGWAHVARMP